ncbi:beclin [Geosmithia morbida]|uniref:Beclin n=1 Tax=Geosmithia morbida TaxID=1094350 RepID=A0A9P4Z0C7_9HYPO|nr:beclin [Geosmithia morbida]KAF4125092.1 beclin [Geosmithia morbida]
MFCQKCRQPLRLDGSLEDLNPAAYDLIISSSSPQTSRRRPSSPASQPLKPSSQQDRSRKALYDEASKQSTNPTFKRNHGMQQPRDSTMSFIYLTESQLGHPQSPKMSRTAADTGGSGSKNKASKKSASPAEEADDHQKYRGDEMDRVNRLFEILSSRSDIDHPICVECADMLVEGFQKRLEAASRERDAYAKHLRQLQADQPSKEDVRQQQEATKKSQRDEELAMAELQKLEAEKDGLDAEILALEEESRRLDSEEEAFWRERNAFAASMAEFQSERDSVNVRYANDSQLLQKLQRSNVYNDTFCISHDGSFATINGLRLGRLSTKPVDWPEINAAWGHSLLLLVTVADKLGYTFQGYEPRPMGSTSTIIRYETPSPSSSRHVATSAAASAAPHTSHHPLPPKKHVLELYSSGDMPLGLTFMHRKFDNAMVAFLELVRQLGLHVERQTEATGNTLSLPYRIDGDKISDVSIKLGIAQDDGWTKACKLTLTCCKFLLAHASNVGVTARAGLSSR